MPSRVVNIFPHHRMSVITLRVHCCTKSHYPFTCPMSPGISAHQLLLCSWTMCSACIASKTTSDRSQLQLLLKQHLGSLSSTKEEFIHGIRQHRTCNLWILCGVLRAGYLLPPQRKFDAFLLWLLALQLLMCFYWRHSYGNTFTTIYFGQSWNVYCILVRQWKEEFQGLLKKHLGKLVHLLSL